MLGEEVFLTRGEEFFVVRKVAVDREALDLPRLAISATVVRAGTTSR